MCRNESSILFLYAAYIIAKCGDITPLQLQKNAVLYFEKYSGKVLEEFTHKELPWLKAREGLAQNEPSTRIIDNNLIFEYYTSIKNKYNIVSLADIQSYIDKLW